MGLYAGGGWRDRSAGQAVWRRVVRSKQPGPACVSGPIAYRRLAPYDVTVTPQPPYPNAPITEAALDIRVQLPESVVLSDLATMQTEETARYPGKRQMNAIAVEFQATLGGGSEPADTGSTTRTPNGFMSLSSDERQVFQARLDGFTFSRLAPYDRWETFVLEARRLWARYREVARPTTISRVAIRTINRLDLPLPFADFKEYLRTVPEVSPGLPQGLAGFFMQLQMPQPDMDAMCLLNETMIPPAKPGFVSVVLDTDLYRTGHIASDEAGLWELFETLRARKDEIFEECVTDKARELFR